MNCDRVYCTAFITLSSHWAIKFLIPVLQRLCCYGGRSWLKYLRMKKNPSILSWPLIFFSGSCLLNYPPIRNNLTSASLLSMLIETDYLNYPPIRNNLSSTSLSLSCAGAILKILQYLIKCFRSMTMASLLSMLIETDYNFKKITAVL